MRSTPLARRLLATRFAGSVRSVPSRTPRKAASAGGPLHTWPARSKRVALALCVAHSPCGAIGSTANALASLAAAPLARLAGLLRAFATAQTVVERRAVGHGTRADGRNHVCARAR